KIMADKKSTTPVPLPAVLYRNAPLQPTPYYEIEQPQSNLFTAILIALLGFITVSIIAICLWYRICRHHPAWSTRPHRPPVNPDSPDALIVEK
ncbi:hypothetical protein PFISCL1PPCAC_11275, partial [Pristionchus fissidentatus]